MRTGKGWRKRVCLGEALEHLSGAERAQHSKVVSH